MAGHLSRAGWDAISLEVGHLWVARDRPTAAGRGLAGRDSRLLSSLTWGPDPGRDVGGPL